MSKDQNIFACSKCGAQFLKWAGRCNECGAWGSLTQDMPEAPVSSARLESAKAAKTSSFAGLTADATASRLASGLSAWDRVLCGGLVPGSVTLLGGEPGIGKSTLLAQLALTLAATNKTVLYVTGEESPAQVALRLKRLSPVLPSTLEFLDQTQADAVAATISEKKPALTIVDSIQSLRLADVPGEPGNPSQIKACGALVTEAAKRSNSPVILVGQVTKDGDLAGPRLLEHLVDTVLMMEGDRQQLYRLLRVWKNRFGSTDELAVLQMTERGLEEVLDPSAAFLANRPTKSTGSIVTCLCQAKRPMLVELQALVAPAGYGTPLRRATGIDTNRLSLLLAVLARRAGVNFGDHDVFVNAVGGIDAREPSIDLALVLALASAKLDLPMPAQTATWGEIGLAGEIRPVPQTTLRIKEAARLGFNNLILPPGKEEIPTGVNAIRCATLSEAITAIKNSK